MSEIDNITIEGRIPYDSDKFNQFSDKLIETTRKYFTGDKVLYARVVEALEEKKNIFQIYLIMDEMIDLDNSVSWEELRNRNSLCHKNRRPFT